jgi:hypothetical protein
MEDSNGCLISVPTTPGSFGVWSQGENFRLLSETPAAFYAERRIRQQTTEDREEGTAIGG